MTTLISTGIFASHDSWVTNLIGFEFFTLDLISIGNRIKLMVSWWPSHIIKLHEYFTILTLQPGGVSLLIITTAVLDNMK